MKNTPDLTLAILLLLALFLLQLTSGCAGDSAKANITKSIRDIKQQDNHHSLDVKPIIISDAVEIFERKQIPILCYHKIRDWKASDSRKARDYIVPIENFRSQIKLLADNGYNTITPDQLVNYLKTGASLPDNPILITYDDTNEEQFSIAKMEMDKYDFKGTYFIMTVSLGRPNYMSREQVKQLSDEGHVIGSHTWDHKNVKQYEDEDWARQVDKPREQLEKITGKPIRYFAYPFGLWNNAAIPQLKERDMLAAFQLSAKRDEQNPLYSIRRIIVPGDWSIGVFEERIKTSF